MNQIKTQLSFHEALRTTLLISILLISITTTSCNNDDDNNPSDPIDQLPPLT